MRAVVTGAFDDIGSRDLRLLQEASRLGTLTVLLWDDPSVESIMGRPPKFAYSEREYFLKGMRYVSRVVSANQRSPDALEQTDSVGADLWADTPQAGNTRRREFCAARGLGYHCFADSDLSGFPELGVDSSVCARRSAAGKKVVVTGCYDWLHSGHVRFFEEVSAYGDVYAIVGHDANIRLLKGPGHPLLSQEERCYMVGSIRYVAQALVSTGSGWLDAEPEIERLKPDIYAVNEDGDRGGKREFCRRRGIEYLVLKRLPAPGLPKRSSTDLRGF
jgi:cytidyltransferase-like protein